jgi:hypothetical protein
MATFLAQFQTIKNSCDHLVIAGFNRIPLKIILDIKLKLNFLVGFKFSASRATDLNASPTTLSGLDLNCRWSRLIL